MKRYLEKPNASDEVLLEKLNAAASNEVERRKKHKQNITKPPASNQVESAEVTPAVQKKDTLMEVIQELKADLEGYKALHA